MNFDWNYLFSLALYPDFWRATALVAWLGLLTWVIGTALGFLFALARQSSLRPLRWFAKTYIWLFRSLPLLVLLIFVYNLPQFMPSLGPVLSVPFWAGLIALVISETAYLAEIHRAGLISVDQGQHEAAHALGVRPVGKYRYIILPQAVRVALPALGNEFITIVKLTSLVSVISLAEILLVGQRLYTRNFMVIETLVAVSFYYVFVVSVFSFFLSRLESRLDITRMTGAEIRAPASALSSRTTNERCIGQEVIVELDNVRKNFGDKRALADVSLKVCKGEVVSIIGPSGSGKTTLIRTINALQDIDAGRITLDGVDWIRAGDKGYRVASDFHDRVTRLGMVFQSFNLFPHMTALENVMFGPRYHGNRDKEALRTAAMTHLARVGMATHANKYPHQLSGGQKQRIAIARALAMNPEIMLFDEPTSALDPELVGEVLQVIESLTRDGMTMIIVTHEMRFARRVSDRVIMMENGHIVNDMNADELKDAPADSRIRKFMLQS
ncbi:amino acid ABC transporter permease/ATP-binding protein [Microvirga sp. VF16]|uniref:amino acid ABC transporter permease/ATP-binding protein n=1 Tax=Microvirga sp. VF16 TaxID=2807101 RepID=UPI00193E8445|nr:amino acid ABC transporter permease/ATP-binding protein [Microvirga sp. VF16]QRM32692.1 amino acid ABC transporter permease/ATP-binding protein [Microvirga sp. VF16]